MKVWVVMDIDYDYWEIITAFTDKADADKFVEDKKKSEEHRPRHNRGNYRIEEVGVDEWSKHI